MENEFEIFIYPDGTIRFIYDDKLRSLLEAGPHEIRRCSHVEPEQTGGVWRWFADLSPSGFPIRLGPFTGREEAISAEVEFLTKFVLSRDDKKAKAFALSPSAVRRFWSHIDKKKEDECWLWLDAKSHNGYGKFCNNGNHLRASRVAYFLGHKKIPDDNLMVCHACDNPACCNPSHLFLASQSENMQDAVRKGRHPSFARRMDPKLKQQRKLVAARSRYAKKSGLPGHCKGVAHRSAKLSESDVLDIRELRKSGLSYSSIAKKYLISRSNVIGIVKRRLWKHL